jgi:hypothetical protein
MKRVLLCAALVLWSGLASAVVYKWLDVHGNPQYGDRPPDGVQAEVVEYLGNHSGHPEPAHAATPASGMNSSTPKGASTDANARNAAEKQAVADDVAQAKLKECADAEDRYKKLIEGRKLYKAGADGEREYLTSAEIDAERLDAKRDVDTICNSPT